MSDLLDIKLSYAMKRMLMQQTFRLNAARGTLLISAGMEVKHAWLVRRVFVKHYSHNRKGEYQLHHFYLPGDVMTLEEEFLEGKWAQSNLEVVADAVLLPISHSRFLLFIQHFPQLFIPLMLLMLASKKRLVLKNKLLQCPGEERYQYFIKIFPAAMIMVKDIAAYLHLTPSTLSRIKSRH